MFQRSIVPLDGSEYAEQALPVAARLARASKGSLLLLHVVFPSYGDATWPTGLPIPLAWGTVHEEVEEAKRYLAKLATSQVLAGIDVTTEVRIGQPAEAIFARAQANYADLIVMCSHGHTVSKHWMLGSTAQKVAHYSTIPVFILRAGMAPLPSASSTAARSLRIMVALDGSKPSETVLIPAAYLSAVLSAPERGSLLLVRVLRIPTSFEYGQSDSVSKAKAAGALEAKAYLQTLENRLREGDLGKLHLKITTLVVYDPDVARRLIFIAENYPSDDGVFGSDMIALATHGRSGITRWVMGSVAERVLSATFLPLLIVRPQKEQFTTQASDDPVTCIENASDVESDHVGL